MIANYLFLTTHEFASLAQSFSPRGSFISRHCLPCYVLKGQALDSCEASRDADVVNRCFINETELNSAGSKQERG